MSDLPPVINGRLVLTTGAPADQAFIDAMTRAFTAFGVTEAVSATHVSVARRLLQQSKGPVTIFGVCTIESVPMINEPESDLTAFWNEIVDYPRRKAIFVPIRARHLRLEHPPASARHWSQVHGLQPWMLQPELVIDGLIEASNSAKRRGTSPRPRPTPRPEALGCGTFDIDL